MKLDLLDSPFDGRSLIEASAGTGKTWTLTALYARLLLERQLSVGQILVVTYTTAATAELRERIRARLADLLAVYEGTPSSDDFLNRLHARYPDDASRRPVARRAWLRRGGDLHHPRLLPARPAGRGLRAGGDFDSELTADDREIIDALLADAGAASWPMPTRPGHASWPRAGSLRSGCASVCAVIWASPICGSSRRACRSRSICARSRRPGSGLPSCGSRRAAPGSPSC